MNETTRVGYGAGAAVGLCLVCGCPAIDLPVDITVLLPADDSGLTRTNNVSLTIEPLGVVQTLAADGTDFAVSVTLAPQSDPQTISLFLADDDKLLAWGKTPPVSVRSDGGTVALLVSAADALSRFDAEFDAPDPDALAAPVADIGLLVLASDGTALFVDAFAWQLRAAAALPSETVPDPQDGILIADPEGGVHRIALDGGLSVQRYSPVDNTWSSRAVDEASLARTAERSDGTWMAGPEGASVWLIGGGTHLDTLRLPLSAKDTVAVTVADVPSLDAPRPAATAFVVPARAEQPAHPLLFGVADARPVVFSMDGGVASGPDGPWVGAACALIPAPVLDRDVVCVGGVRDGVPTGDGVLVHLPADGGHVTATVLPDIAMGPMPEPLALAGSTAVYAQGNGRAVHIDAALAATAAVASPARGGGGSAARLPLGLTFVVGGTTADGAPLRYWSTFLPAPPPDR